MREVAQPVLEADSRAKVPMRHKVWGWRTIAREVLAARRPPAPPARAEAHREATPSDALQAAEDAQAVVRE